MNKITIISVGALKEQSFKRLVTEYQKRISPYVRLELLETRAYPFSGANKKRAKEQEKQALEKVLHNYSKEQIYLLAEEGRQYNSLSFAGLINDYDGKDLVFVIAGALGWDDEWEKKYQRISLSPLTFPHELAKLILMEQIYRAVCINMAKDYHY